MRRSIRVLLPKLREMENRLLFRLMLLMTVLPALELTMLIKVHGYFAQTYGGFMGFFVTVGTIIMTGVIGANLARQQGIGVLKRLQENLAQGKAPTQEALDGIMILVGGAMLLTPGFFTDFCGLTMLFAPTRAVYKVWLLNWAKRKIASGEIKFQTPGGGGFADFSSSGQDFSFRAHQFSHQDSSVTAPSPHAKDPDVIDVEVLDD